MAFSWVVGIAVSSIVIVLIILCGCGIKSQKFTMKELGIISLTARNKPNDNLSTSPYFSVKTLVTIRLTIAIFALFVLSWGASFPHQARDSNQPSIAFYISWWGWLILIIYFILSIISTYIIYFGKYCGCLKTEICIKYLRICIWIIFECLVPLVIWIAFVGIWTGIMFENYLHDQLFVTSHDQT